MAVRQAHSKEECMELNKGKDYKVPGTTFTLKNGNIAEVITCNKWSDIDVIIRGGVRDYVVNTCQQNLSGGMIKNPFYRSTFGVGYLGIRRAPVGDKQQENELFDVWSKMIGRVHGRDRASKAPSYSEVTISPEFEEFYCYLEFALDLMKKAGITRLKKNYHFDKDILGTGGKCYSAETIVLVPRIINLQFVAPNSDSKNPGYGVYKTGKSKYRGLVSCGNEKRGLTVSTDGIGDARAIYRCEQFAVTEKCKLIQGLLATYLSDNPPAILDDRVIARMKGYRAYLKELCLKYYKHDIDAPEPK